MSSCKILYINTGVGGLGWGWGDGPDLTGASVVGLERVNSLTGCHLLLLTHLNTMVHTCPWPVHSSAAVQKPNCFCRHVSST